MEHRLESGRRAWLQVGRGAAAVNGTSTSQGDGAAIESESRLTIAAAQESEVLLFDLP